MSRLSSVVLCVDCVASGSFFAAGVLGCVQRPAGPSHGNHRPCPCARVSVVCLARRDGSVPSIFRRIGWAPVGFLRGGQNGSQNEAKWKQRRAMDDRVPDTPPPHRCTQEYTGDSSPDGLACVWVVACCLSCLACGVCACWWWYVALCVCDGDTGDSYCLWIARLTPPCWWSRVWVTVWASVWEVAARLFVLKPLRCRGIVHHMHNGGPVP